MKALSIHWRILLLLISCSSLFLFACEKNNNVILENETNSTLRSKEYSLSPVGGSGITGKLIVTENPNKSFNIKVELDNTVKDTLHRVYIINGTVDNKKPSIAIPLTGVAGNGGNASSLTINIIQASLPGGNIKFLTYNSFLQYDGCVKVNYSTSRAKLVIAQGNIGKN